jgi:hypothetical protein
MSFLTLPELVDRFHLNQRPCPGKNVSKGLVWRS